MQSPQRPTDLREVDWARFSDPTFEYEFDYPESVSGAAVRVRRLKHAGGEAIHVSTEDGSTVYFEVDRTQDRGATDGIARLESDVGGRFADARFGQAIETELCGSPALTVEFQFADRVRRAIFSESSSPSYRVILDPRSATNLQLLATLRPRDPSV